MHETQQKIIRLLRKVNSELSTSQILERIDQNYKKLKKNSNSEETKRNLAKHHRKILHHLNKLVNSGLLTITKHGEKGKKFFSLNLKDNEEILENGQIKRKIPFKRNNITIPIEGYEEKGLILKYKPGTWIDKLNSIVLFCDKIKNLEKLQKTLTEKVFPSTNDTICLENLDNFREDISQFIERIDKECENYGRNISITIEISKIKNKENFFKTLQKISEKINITLIFSLNPQEIEEHSNLIEKIIETYSKNKLDLYIKNKKIQKAPYFIGKAGPYCFIDKEWQLSEDIINKIACLACSQSSVIVDVNKFYKEFGLNIDKFSELMLNISKSVLSANSIQRRNSKEYFSDVFLMNNENEAELLCLSRNYIRFWNYGLSEEGIDDEFVLNMINEAKKKIDEFSTAEETIYKSCGMTTRFKVALSCAFKSPSLSVPKYKSIKIKNSSDLYNTEVKETISSKENICKIFDGGNRVSLSYTGTLDVKEITKIIEKLMEEKQIPLIRYNFKEVRGDLKLSSFLKW